MVKRHVLGGESVSAICEDLGIAPNLFYRWQKELFDHTDAVVVSVGKGDLAVFMRRSRWLEMAMRWV